jgi:predicted nucleotidyltransferase
MRDLSRTPEALLGPIARVVESMLTEPVGIEPGNLMVVGAWCRDIWHHAMGHTFATSATRDLDLALALSSWEAFDAVARSFPRIGDTGIRFRIAGFTVDLLPFGDIEDPRGTDHPPTRDTTMSVWAFEEIRSASLPLVLPGVGEVRIPTVPGLAASKLAAWLDRSEWREIKDAADLALILFWYAESADIHDRLYDTREGNSILLAESADLQLAAAHLLGVDVANTLGPQRTSELAVRWPGDASMLARELRFVGDRTWPVDRERGRELVAALSAGLLDEQAGHG